MKENQTKTVVCKHCGQPHKVAEKHTFLFYEEWWAARPKEYTSPRTGLTVALNPYNLTREEWESCRPHINQRELIHQLHNRITALEAALAEKGGPQ